MADLDKHGILAIIPARGGSKGVPLKNIRSLCGKPL
ncbi:MAG: acylneuraminate cytidylyltransferase family protein, partial [Elusimicrobiota bacterium]